MHSPYLHPVHLSFRVPLSILNQPLTSKWYKLRKKWVVKIAHTIQDILKLSYQDLHCTYQFNYIVKTIYYQSDDPTVISIDLSYGLTMTEWRYRRLHWSHECVVSLVITCLLHLLVKTLSLTSFTPRGYTCTQCTQQVMACTNRCYQNPDRRGARLGLCEYNPNGNLSKSIY